ncbi:reverse transcriptase domain-containing protein [Tanacetum coccineum]
MISPAFVEANYEVLESLIRERRRQRHNENLRTELEYFSEEYDEEREMEPRPTRVREAIPISQAVSSRVRRQKERVVEIEDAPNKEGSKVERNNEGGRGHHPSTNIGGNLPPNGTHLSCNAQPFNLQPSNGPIPVQGVAPPSEDLPPINPIGDMLCKPPREVAFPYLMGSCTPQLDRGLPLLDGLKMPSHVGSYDGKGDPSNFLHLFESAIRSILNYEDLKAKFRFHFSQQKKFTKTHLAVYNIKQKEGESTRAFVTRKKENKEIAPVEAPILMISSQDQTQKRKSAEEPINGLGEITFPPVLDIKNSSDPVLKPALQSLRVDSWVPLVGFSREHSWPLGEVPLEITIGDGSLIRTEVLNFVIIWSNSPHNLLLGRTTMQRMGIVVSTIHGKIKFHIPKGIGTVLSTYDPPERDERKNKSKTTCSEIAKNVLSYRDAEERIIFNTKNLAKGEKPNVGSQPSHGEEKRRKMENVESLSGFQLKYFLDAYKGYHQIQMAEEDEDKTAFFAGKEVFCYQKMPFGLKNARATYQRLGDKIFGDLIRRNLEAYVNDMVIKSTAEEDMLQDIHYKSRNKGQPVEGQGSDRSRSANNAQRNIEPQWEASNT